MHLAPAPTAAGPHHNGQHVPGHRTRRPGHIHPAQQVEGTRHTPPRCRIPRPGTAPTKTPTAAHPGGQTDTGARQGKKVPPTRPSPHHRPPRSPPTKGLRYGPPHHPGGASPPHHHRCPIHPRCPRTPLGPHNHPSDAPTTAGPQRSHHPLPHRSTPKLQGHPTPPTLQDRTSHRIVGHPGHAPPTTRHPHPQSGRPMVGPPLGTRSPHGGPGLYPGNRPR